MVSITYNGSNPFQNLAPTPLVGRDLSPINQKRFGLKDSITLNGTITGDCDGNFQSSYLKYLQLVNNFSENFKAFEILENGSGVFRADYAYIKSISISDNKWYGIIPFTIELESYSSGNFASGKFGISQSKNEISFSENDDCTVSISHSISAVGVNTNLQAFQNASNYVSSLTGWNNQVTPAFISGQISPILISSSESIDRMGGGYSASFEYLYDKNLTIPNTSGILRYSVEKREDQDATLISLQGNLIGGENLTNDILRANFNKVNFYALAKNSFNYVDIYNIPTSFSCNEDPLSNSIDFSLEYSNQVIEDPYFIDDTSIQYDYSTDGIVLKVGGTIKSNNPCSGFLLAKNYYNSLDVLNLARTAWLDYGSGSFIQKPIGQSYSEDIQNRSVSFSLDFSSKKDNFISDCIESIDYSMTFSPSINQYAVAPILNGSGDWSVTDLNYKNRAKFSINGSAKVSPCCSEGQAFADMKIRLNQISSEYFDGYRKIIESQDLKYDENKSTIEFSANWSAETLNVIP